MIEKKDFSVSHRESEAINRQLAKVDRLMAFSFSCKSTISAIDNQYWTIATLLFDPRELFFDVNMPYSATETDFRYNKLLLA